MGLALCAVYAMFGDVAIGADWRVRFYRRQWWVHIAELCEFLHKERSNKHVYLFVGYRVDYHYYMPIIRLSCGIYYGYGRFQNAASYGYAVYPAYVDQLPPAHDCNGGVVPYVRLAIGRRSIAVWYGVRLLAVYDLSYLQHLAEDGY